MFLSLQVILITSFGNFCVVHLLFQMSYFNREQVPINNWLLEEVKQDFDAKALPINKISNRRLSPTGLSRQQFYIDP